MIYSEIQRVIADLKRATTYVVSTRAGSVEEALERVSDNVSKIIARIEASQKGQLYKSIYPAQRTS